MAISATQLTLIFSIFFAIFSLHRTNFSQIPQELFTELIGLALLFSLEAGALATAEEEWDIRTAALHLRRPGRSGRRRECIVSQSLAQPAKR